MISLFSSSDLFNTLIKDLTEELSHDENINNTDVLKEKKKVLGEDSAKNITQNETKIILPEVKLDIFFHDILEGPKLEINEIRENENRVLNNEKYGSHGILESLNREDDEDGVDCSSEKGCMYVQYTLSSKFSDKTTILKDVMYKSKSKGKSVCEDDNKMEKVIWDDDDALCIVAVSGPESLVPGTPLYTYAEEPYEIFEYTEEPRCLPGRSPSPPLNPLAVAGNSTSFSTFSKNSLHGYMRLPLPMHSGWYVVSYVRTYIVGTEKNKTCDDNENDDENEKGNKNEINLINTNIAEETVKNNIPSIIIRKRIELGKSELFNIEVPVQGVGEDVLLPCNKGVRRRGAGYLGGPIWEGTGPMEEIVKILDVTVEDLKSIKTLSLTISLPHLEKNRNIEDEKLTKDDEDIERTELILCRAMVWAYDVNEEKKEEKKEEKIIINCGKKVERDAYKNRNMSKRSSDSAIDDDNDDSVKSNNNRKNNNCNNDDNDIKQRTVLRIVVEADVITIHRNNGVVTVESVRTAYGILNIDDNDIIQSILNSSKFDDMNDNMPCPSSKKGRTFPLNLTGSTGSINRYGQFISRIFYGGISGGNIRFKDTISPHSKNQETLLPSNPKTVNQVKSDSTDSTITSSSETHVKKKEKNFNNDIETITADIIEITDTDTDVDIDICCGFCDTQLVPLGEINQNLPMPTGEFDDVSMLVRT